MQVDAFLCDAATVRENLLHVLGGGITRTWHDNYPAPLGLALAMMLTLQPTEAGDHKLRVILQDQDGVAIVSLDGGFQVTRGPDARPGELLAVPLVLALHNVAIPKAGTYSVEVLVDSHHIRSLVFASSPRPTPKAR
jgi:hypothetical protein